MKKNLYILFLLLFLFIIIDGTIKLREEYIIIKTFLTKKNNDIVFIKSDIKNKVNYIDKETKVKINNVVAIKKNVFIYQWVENIKHLKKINDYLYTYEKKWVKNSIDSTNFKDKSKNNFTNKNIYHYEEIIPEYLIVENNYKINGEFFHKKIKFKNYLFNENYIKGKPLNKKFVGEYKEEKTYSDLDSYVASNNKVFAKNKKEKFKVIDNYVLYNGKNFEDPEIGDTKIIYEVFFTDFITFIGGKKEKELGFYNKFFILDFTGKDKDEILFEEKLKFIFGFFIFINISTFFINKILLAFKDKKIKFLILKYIPYFNEYFVFSKNNKLNVFLFFLLLIAIIMEIYFLIIGVILTFIYLRNIDYYSI